MSVSGRRGAPVDLPAYFSSIARGQDGSHLSFMICAGIRVISVHFIAGARNLKPRDETQRNHATTRSRRNHRKVVGLQTAKGSGRKGETTMGVGWSSPSYSRRVPPLKSQGSIC